MTRFGHSRLLRAACLTTGFATLPVAVPALAQQAIYPVVVDNSPDPLLANVPATVAAAQNGSWSGMVNWPIVAIHSAVLPDGRVLNFGAAPGGTVQDGRTLVFWDPRKGTGSNSFEITPDAQNVDSFCGTATLLSDGQLLVSGGASNASGYSSRESTVVNWRSSTPKRDYDLTAQRWYATMIKLPDGRVVITGGSAPYANADPTQAPDSPNHSVTPEIYTPGQGWRSLTGAYSTDAFGAKNTHWWYPRGWVSPAGTVFGISTEKMWEMNPAGNGTIRTVGTFKSAANNTTRPNVGPTSTAVMYDVGKILQVGGNGYYNGYDTLSSAAASIIDITGIAKGAVTVADTASMTYPRQWATATVLPTGRVLVTGGSLHADDAGSNAVLAAETWDPATGKWTIGPAMATYRGYHSTATLLPDGVVMISGGGIPGPVINSNTQFYYPPYIFTAAGNGATLATRPVMVSLSTNTVDYGGSLLIQLAQGSDAVSASLIGLPSVTHAFNSNQRRIPLTLGAATGGVAVTMPASANIAPPGYYYLSVVNKAGVPSISAIIAVHAAAPSTTAGAPPAVLEQPPVGTSIGNYGSAIAAGSDGTIATANATNQLWASSLGQNWYQLSGSYVELAVRSASRIYAIGTDQSVNRWDGSRWAVIGWQASSISVAADGTLAVINAADGRIWIKTTDTNDTDWRVIPGGVVGKRVAVLSARSIYFIGQDGNVWRTDASGDQQMVGHNASDIAASSDGSVTVVSTAPGQVGTIWRKPTDDAQFNWSQLPGTAVRIAVPGGGRLVTRDTNGTIWLR